MTGKKNKYLAKLQTGIHLFFYYYYCEMTKVAGKRNPHPVLNFDSIMELTLAFSPRGEPVSPAHPHWSSKVITA